MKLEILRETELFNISEDHMEYFNHMEEGSYIRWNYIYDSSRMNHYDEITIFPTTVDAHPMTIQILIDTINLYIPKRKKFKYRIEE
jgi:hypothetical protein